MLIRHAAAFTRCMSCSPERTSSHTPSTPPPSLTRGYLHPEGTALSSGEESRERRAKRGGATKPPSWLAGRAELGPGAGGDGPDRLEGSRRKGADGTRVDSARPGRKLGGDRRSQGEGEGSAGTRLELRILGLRFKRGLPPSSMSSATEEAEGEE